MPVSFCVSNRSVPSSSVVKSLYCCDTSGRGEMANASVSKTDEETLVGSNPTARTKRDVAELADATVLGAVAARRVGSSPTISTIRGVAKR